MATGKKEGYDSKAQFGLFATVVSTFVILLGLVWNQATWQSTVSKDVQALKNSQSIVIKKLEAQEALIKQNTGKLSELEATINESISREDMILWIFSLKEMNPEIAVPIPDKKD